ncbi:peptide/nickel transport system substrate-binding protein [Microbacterium sp. W4I4]|uniref:ABC transporter substrate-binding protein n=1 Tax=Microbacterium sp. W4I4 TaxID=3042295 RepID=UPI002789766E|nr:ABC transporter substrate-binding protein [Microbacterium sp. W4I4]MDQ0614433.1 peptide/nickel transport system substrate-binding protein [Microbacterium sp. W4I4]
MTSLRARVRSVAALAAVAALVLTGCSGGPGKDAGSTEPLPDAEQNLTYIPSYGWAGTDISKYPLEIGVEMAISQTMETLVTLDKEGKPKAKLAESWEWTDDTTLTFTLRDDVTFSDGAPLTAADVKGSIERYIAQQGPLKTVLAPITEVIADDDHTVTIKTSVSSGTLLGVLSLVYIGQAKFSHTDLTAAADNDYWALPIGTGPFVIKDYVANDRFAFERNEKYWGEKAKLKTLTMKQVTDVNGKITALSNGEAQVIGDVPHDQVDQVKGMSNVTFTQEDSLNYYFLWFDNKNEFLKDQRVREAMWAALDLKTIQESLFGDTAAVMKSFCPVAAFGCVEPTDGMVKYDPKHAKELLAEAGHADGLTVDAIYSNANGAGFANMMQAFISAWAEVGITVEPKALDAATWLSTFSTVNDDGTHGWNIDVQPNQTITGDADYTIYRLYNCTAGRLGYCNQEFDEITMQAQRSTDPDERLALYQKAIDIMRADTPAIPLFQINVNVATASNVKGLEIPANEFIDFRTVYLTK